MIELLAGVRSAGESDRAVVACNDWLRMGAGRTLVKINQNQPKSTKIGTLKVWSARYEWAARAAEFDAAAEKKRRLNASDCLLTGTQPRMSGLGFYLSWLTACGVAYSNRRSRPCQRFESCADCWAILPPRLVGAVRTQQHQNQLWTM